MQCVQLTKQFETWILLLLFKQVSARKRLQCKICMYTYSRRFLQPPRIFYVIGCLDFYYVSWRSFCHSTFQRSLWCLLQDHPDTGYAAEENDQIGCWIIVQQKQYQKHSQNLGSWQNHKCTYINNVLFIIYIMIIVLKFIYCQIPFFQLI